MEEKSFTDVLVVWMQVAIMFGILFGISQCEAYFK